MTTKSIHHEYYKKLFENENESLLSQAALETLAIIAYNQPITRVEVDEYRGVNTLHMVRRLINKGLVEVKGKSSMPGKPNLYGTTREFLDYFGINRIEDLPEITKVEEVDQNQDLFTSIYKENVE